MLNLLLAARSFRPQLMQQLCAHNLGRQHADHAQYENSVELEIFVDEFLFLSFRLERNRLASIGEQSALLDHHGRALVKLLEVLEHVEATVYVAAAVLGQHAAHPLTHGPEIGAEQYKEPEPEEREDLLIVQVYGQHTLNGVAVTEVWMAELADSKVAHDHLGKVDRLGRALLAVRVGHVAENVYAELVELLAQELVHHKELHDRVEEVDDFYEEVSGDQVVTQVDARAAEERIAEEFHLLKYRIP